MTKAGTKLELIVVERGDAALTLASSGHPARENGVQAIGYAALLVGPGIGQHELWGYGGVRTAETAPVWCLVQAFEELLARSLEETPSLQPFVGSAGFMQHPDRVIQWIANGNINAQLEEPDALSDLRRFVELSALVQMRKPVVLTKGQGNLPLVRKAAKGIAQLAFERGANVRQGLGKQGIGWATAADQ